MTHQNQPTLGGNGWAFIPLLHQSLDVGSPRKTLTLGEATLQLRQNLEGLTVEDCWLTELPAAGTAGTTRPSKRDICVLATQIRRNVTSQCSFNFPLFHFSIFFLRKVELVFTNLRPISPFSPFFCSTVYILCTFSYWVDF